uniref:Protein kinase domain-containing protein n=1 Tax=Periophthalmus magnuspinnatus TaxID=409849 RepID=A0A3B3ZQP0_9GOBI
MSSSLINSLAKVYDPNPLQKSGARKLSLCGSEKSQPLTSSSSSSCPVLNDPLRCVESRMDSLSSQMERLLNMQQTVLTRLDGLSQDVRGMGRDLALMRGDGGSVGSRRSSGDEAGYRELRVAVERTGDRVDVQGRRLETVERIVEGTQQVISYIGEVVKSSRLVELLFKQPGRKGRRKVKDAKSKDEKDKAKGNLKGVKVQKKRKAHDGSDFSPPPSAPFDHRIVTPKPHQIATYYTINREEVLGGRFGQVHKCIENSSGLTLAAKIIKARSQKEKEVVRNEIQVMNQLNHANLIQLYAAFESRHDIILVMEVEGGELFDRIIDENYNLTELDTVLFIRQICEGLQYMHKMYILHLDLKPENILCVSRVTNKIKIIDFGLARYKPREKLRVNFGTPEFLAPEVINYEFVSFPTDMWSLGVITYMLSGLSPFLGDDDNETLNNILACQWNFEEEEFTDVSDEAKDFITRLLVKSKWRMSATESLKHPWLSDQELHYKLDQKKNKCHSTHAPPPES